MSLYFSQTQVTSTDNHIEQISMTQWITYIYTPCITRDDPLFIWVSLPDTDKD